MAPRDGLEWLTRALYLMLSRPRLFIAAALLAPAGSAFLLALPWWEITLPTSSQWLTVIATVVCYGLPMNLTISLACGFARAANREQPPSLKQLLIPGILGVLFRSSLFLLALLLQGYLAMYLIQDLLKPTAMLAAMEGETLSPGFSFAVTDTLLGTQLNMLGGLLLILQILFACFVTPLYLFRELPLFVCWRLSFLAIQLNPWLWPALGLPGLLLILMASFETFAIPAQILALPLPAYFGALLFVAWLEIFQGGVDETTELTEPAITRQRAEQPSIYSLARETY